MRTIGRKWPTTAPHGDRQTMCSYCGVQWRRSQLRRDEGGNLVCPDEGPGKDTIALSRGNAEAARNFRQVPDGEPGGPRDYDLTVTPQPGQDLAPIIGGVTFGRT